MHGRGEDLGWNLQWCAEMSMADGRGRTDDSSRAIMRAGKMLGGWLGALALRAQGTQHTHITSWAWLCVTPVLGAEIGRS